MTAAPTPLIHSLSRAVPNGALFWLSIVAILAMSLPNLFDPMVRYDDYPALFAEPDGFWPKTLHEGRWLNYIWHLRGFETPAWLNYTVYQTLWAVFAAALASCVAGQMSLSKFTISLALFVLVSPSALLISLWFNTLLPGLALVALFAVLACITSQKTLLFLLPIFVVLTFMAYTTYPLLLLAVCLMQQQRRSIPKLIGLLALFTLSFIVAILATYTLNLLVHDVFGVPLAEWREATPAKDWQGLLANMPKLWSTFSTFAHTTSFEFTPAIYFHLLLFSGSLTLLLRFATLEALYLLAGLITGLTLMVAQILKLGVEVPVRTFIFIWIFYGIVVVRAAEIATQKHAFAGRMAFNAVFLIIASYSLQSYMQARTYQDWQQETRELALHVADFSKPVTYSGDPMNSLAGVKAGVQSNTGFEFRMQQLGIVGVVQHSGKAVEKPTGSSSGFYQSIHETDGQAIIVFE